jgi:hypothetical protein
MKRDTLSVEMAIQFNPENELKQKKDDCALMT